jgi:4-hydroxy-4-methyl-2-oxoglutarate aldolase
MNTPTDPNPNIVRLRRLDACAMSDAMDTLNLTGVASGFPQQSGSGRIAGEVITVKLGTGEPPPGPPRHLCCTAISLAGPAHVIVIEQRTGIDAGSWGGLLTLGAKLRGVAGAIVDGPVRDIDEAQVYGFPIFTHSLTARTARGRIIEKATNVPVTIGAVTVDPGDYVIADRSGVVFIGAAQIGVVLDAAELIAAREAGIAKLLLGGTPICEALGGNYEYMLQAHALGNRTR